VEFEVNGKFHYRLGVPGPHNASNALAAIAVGRRFGMEHDEIAARLSPEGGFVLPAMRLESRRLPWRSGSKRGEIEIINDAYNANPSSVSAAIDVLRNHAVGPAGRRVIVLGEMRELGPRSGEFHDGAAREVAAAGIDVMVAVGAHAERMADIARRAAESRTEVHAVPDTEAAAKRVGTLCRPGDVVLIKGSRAAELDRVADALAQSAN
jgi:UDP-N-acetylmuramoyl-tripeptide--D-alanyl-D-alanine ligase